MQTPDAKGKPVFIVGVMRSGTSLLHSLINQHPAMGLMYESDVWNFPRAFSGWRFRRNWLERQELFNQCLSRHRLVLNGSLRGMEAVQTPGQLYETYARLKPATFYGEKSPFYCTRLEALSRQYPEASFIIIWRDPYESHRSAAKAAQTSPFFRKRGILNRQIYYQEELLRQSARLEQRGVRVFRLNYAELVEHPEACCRRLCGFLGLEFDARMLRLDQADLSAVNPDPHHDFLRRGIIERQKYSEPLVSPAVTQKLSRYRVRWERLQSTWLGTPENKTNQSEPGWLERGADWLAGSLLHRCDEAVRLGFEVLPIAWLLTYRQFKSWLLNQPPTALPAAIVGKSRRADQIPSLIVAMIYLAVVASIHLHTNPHLSLLPFYIFPCVALALVTNLRWATIFALAGSVIVPLMQLRSPDYQLPQVLLWNSFMRFVLIEAMVLLFSRLRTEITERDEPTA